MNWAEVAKLAPRAPANLVSYCTRPSSALRPAETPAWASFSFRTPSKLSLLSAGGQVNFFGGTGALLDITTSGGQFEHVAFIGSLGPETLDAQGNKSLNHADYLVRAALPYL